MRVSVQGLDAMDRTLEEGGLDDDGSHAPGELSNEARKGGRSKGGCREVGGDGEKRDDLI